MLLDGRAEVIRLLHLKLRQAPNRAAQHVLDLRHHVVAAAHPVGFHVRVGHHRAVAVHGQGHHHNPVVRHLLARPQLFHFNRAALVLVNHHLAGGHGLAQPGLLLVQFQRVTVVQNKDAVGGVAHGQRHLLVRLLVQGFTVHRSEIERFGERDHRLQLVLVAVAARVDGGRGVGNHVRAAPHQVVDDAVDFALVARDRAGAEDDRVAFVHLQAAVFAPRHLAEGGVGFALAPRQQHHQLLGRVVAHFVHRNQRFAREPHVFHLPRQVQGLLHTAAHDDDLAAELMGDQNRLLHPVQVATKGGDEHPAPRPGHQRPQALGHRAFTQAPARRGGIGGVADQQQHTLLPQLDQPRHVGQLPVHRREIELKVGRKQHNPVLGADGQGARLGDGVRHAHKFHFQVARRHLGAGLHFHHLGHRPLPAVVQAQFNQGQCELGAVDRATNVR